MVGDVHGEVVVCVMACLKGCQIRGGGAESEGCCVAACQAVADTPRGRAGGLKGGQRGTEVVTDMAVHRVQQCIV